MLSATNARPRATMPLSCVGASNRRTAKVGEVTGVPGTATLASPARLPDTTGAYERADADRSCDSRNGALSCSSSRSSWRTGRRGGLCSSLSNRLEPPSLWPRIGRESRWDGSSGSPALSSSEVQREDRVAPRGTYPPLDRGAASLSLASSLGYRCGLRRVGLLCTLLVGRGDEGRRW